MDNVNSETIPKAQSQSSMHSLGFEPQDLDTKSDTSDKITRKKETVIQHPASQASFLSSQKSLENFSSFNQSIDQNSPLELASMSDNVFPENLEGGIELVAKSGRDQKDTDAYSECSENEASPLLSEPKVVNGNENDIC